jgi:hypothetical protein
LPAVLDSLNAVESVNITMGFPLKNLSFSNAIKKLFYLQKQQEKKSSSYYYADVLPILEELPNDEKDSEVIRNFIFAIEERNIVYISKTLLQELLETQLFSAFTKPENYQTFLDLLINFVTSSNSKNWMIFSMRILRCLRMFSKSSKINYYLIRLMLK